MAGGTSSDIVRRGVRCGVQGVALWLFWGVLNECMVRRLLSVFLGFFEGETLTCKNIKQFF